MCPKYAVIVDAAVMGGGLVAKYATIFCAVLPSMRVGLCYSSSTDVIDAFGFGRQGTVLVPMINLCSIWDSSDRVKAL